MSEESPTYGSEARAVDLPGGAQIWVDTDGCFWFGYGRAGCAKLGGIFAIWARTHLSEFGMTQSSRRIVIDGDDLAYLGADIDGVMIERMVGTLYGGHDTDGPMLLISGRRREERGEGVVPHPTPKTERDF